MKRFWDNAVAVTRPEGGHAVLLDGRPLRLPGGKPLATASGPLAEAIAAEWQAAGEAKGGEMTMEHVPLTRLLGTAQDRVAPDPAAMVAGLAKYGETDLLCYRADDPALAELQSREWQPLLDWAAAVHGAPLTVTAGLMPVTQPEASLAALRDAVAAHRAEELAALGVAVPSLGSLVLGLALSAGRIAAAEAHRLAVIDEVFQERRWGEDPERLERRARAAQELALAERFLALVRA
ncbi:ATP12 family chaperone protein [Neoroseomonas oryzicola]|uniref:Chaperone, ATP12 n=1 Tax=Neoroseomonas oryzicola TaxID=535904 RepID=A0A9X9WHV1_9PROT|nr:ATP12 family protein [Neoroseomonas oryzicola]MBR0659911.1 chaperone, ATP12 [Neoroseomonas oryzicola]NKE16454.1 chaperone, ATP12 [Neoroseomonas oryzicola]